MIDNSCVVLDGIKYQVVDKIKVETKVLSIGNNPSNKANPIFNKMPKINLSQNKGFFFKVIPNNNSPIYISITNMIL